MNKHTHTTTDDEAREIVKMYEDGQTLTYAALTVCKLPQDANDLRFNGDIFYGGCEIEYQSQEAISNDPSNH